MTSRARPLPPDERRAALVRVVRELVDAEGAVPSTARIARRAGVAEGTIFRAFGTKEALLDATLQSWFCPADFLESLGAIDRGKPLRARLVDLVGLTQARLRRSFSAIGVFGMPPGPPPHGDHRACLEAGHHVVTLASDAPPLDPGETLRPAMIDVVGTDEDQLTVPPSRLVHLLRLLAFAGAHAGIADGHTLSPEEVVDTILLGVLAPDARPELPEGTTCS